MFSEKELSFIQHWEKVRDHEKLFLTKLKNGLPMAMLFGLPILLLLVGVYFYLPEWYTKVSGAASGEISTLLIAVCLIIIFFSYFRMHFKWEMNEQLYLELKSREKTTPQS